MTGKTANLKDQGIFVEGKPLETYLEDKAEKEKTKEILETPQEKHHLHKKPRHQYTSEKLRTMPGRTLPRPMLISKFFERIIKEKLMDPDVTKTDLVATVLMGGETQTALSITAMLKDQGVKIERFDTTSILTRITKSPAGRYINVDRRMKPFKYQVLSVFSENMTPQHLVSLYRSRDPFSQRDAERLCPELVGQKATGYVDNEPDADAYVDSPPDKETDQVIGAEHPTGLAKAADTIAPKLTAGNDVRIHFSFGPIRILFGIDGGDHDGGS